MFGKPLIAAGNVLARASNHTSLENSELDAALRSTLERVEPIYRKAWWSAHRESNERWKTAIDPLLAEHGGALVEYVTRVYGMPWPPEGTRCESSPTPTGRFSTTGPLLLISSRDSGNLGLHALETVIHESMHQPRALATVGKLRRQTLLR